MSNILTPHTEAHSSAIAYFAGQEIELAKVKSGLTLWVRVQPTAERDKAYEMIIQHKETT